VAGYSLGELTAMSDYGQVTTAAKLKTEYGFDVAELKDGCTPSELRNIFPLLELHAGGIAEKELVDVYKFTPGTLRTDHCHVCLVRDGRGGDNSRVSCAGVVAVLPFLQANEPMPKCLEAGRSLQECKDAGYPLSEFSGRTLQELATAGFGLHECLEITGCEPAELLRCKAMSEEQDDNDGDDSDDEDDVKFFFEDAQELQKAGCTVSDFLKLMTETTRFGQRFDEDTWAGNGPCGIDTLKFLIDEAGFDGCDVRDALRSSDCCSYESENASLGADLCQIRASGYCNRCKGEKYLFVGNHQSHDIECTECDGQYGDGCTKAEP
jgi:hypothetical protein